MTTRLHGPDSNARADRGWRAWLAALAVYRDRRLLAIFGMGFSSGMPLPLVMATLGYWLARNGVDKTSIGLFAWVGAPYFLKFLWAPALDHVMPPLLGRLGRRRGWILIRQAALAIAIALLGRTDPSSAPMVTAVAALAVAFFSASQDIAVDAYRIEILADHEQGAGAAATQAGARVGTLVSGAGAIALADFTDWSDIFLLLACLLGASMLFVVFAPEPARSRPAVAAPEGDRDRLADLRRAFWAPLEDLAARPRWGLILGFALLYKVGESIAGAMSNPFYVELGFTGVEIASITKLLGIAATVVGIAVGGVLVARATVRPALALGGVLQALTNLLYVWLAYSGHDVSVLAIAIVADSFTGGLASAAFVAYFSSLSRGAFSASQYALLTSLMAMGRTFFAGGSGWLAERTDWPAFFAWTALLALPGLLLLMVLPDPARRTSPPEMRSRAD